MRAASRWLLLAACLVRNCVAVIRTATIQCGNAAGVGRGAGTGLQLHCTAARLSPPRAAVQAAARLRQPATSPPAAPPNQPAAAARSSLQAIVVQGASGVLQHPGRWPPVDGAADGAGRLLLATLNGLPPPRRVVQRPSRVKQPPPPRWVGRPALLPPSGFQWAVGCAPLSAALCCSYATRRSMPIHRLTPAPCCCSPRPPPPSPPPRSAHAARICAALLLPHRSACMLGMLSLS